MYLYSILGPRSKEERYSDLPDRQVAAMFVTAGRQACTHQALCHSEYFYQRHFQNAIVAVENPSIIFPSPQSRKIVHGSFVGRLGGAGYAVSRQSRKRSVSEIRKSLPPAALKMNLDGCTDSVTLHVTLELSYCCLRFTSGPKANIRLTYGPSDEVKRTY